MPKLKLDVCKSDLENLRASGITDATIRRNRLRTEGGALVFPYRRLDGKMNGFARTRPHNPPVDKNGKSKKYLQGQGTGCRAYFPQASLAKLRKGEEPIYITEGEKKALALSQLGLAAVGLGGVDAWRVKGTNELIDDLTKIAWEGQTVYLTFDYDPALQSRLNVNTARKKLAEVLLEAGAERVLAVQLPGSRKKVGVDDYLVEHGEFAFGKLAADAPDAVDMDENGEANKVVKLVIYREPELGPAALYGLAGDFVRSLDGLTEASAPCLLGQFLPMIASVEKGPYIGNTGQPARLFSLMVGETSVGRKGTGWSWIDRLMRLAVPEFWGEQKTTGLSSGEGLVARLQDRWEVDEDGNKTLVVVDKRLPVVEEEFASVLSHMRRDGNTLAHILRCAFDNSGDLETLTVERRKAPGTHVCIVAHCSPEELRQRLGYIDQINGFANRFLLWYVRSDKVLSKQQAIPDSILLPVAKRVGRVYRFFTSREVGERPVELGKDAQSLWDEVYPGLRDDAPGMVGAMTARRAAIALRLGLVYWGMDNPRKQRAIGRKHLEAALAVVDYCEQSTQMLFGDRTGLGITDRIIELLREKPMKTTELNTHFSNSQKAEVGGHLATLEAQNRIQRKKESKGRGRPATVWSLRQ